MTLSLTPIKLPIQDWARILQLGAESRGRELQTARRLTVIGVSTDDPIDLPRR